MRPTRLARLLVRLYPRAWRRRYGDEWLALVSDGGLTPRAVVDVLRSAVVERAHAIAGGLAGAETRSWAVFAMLGVAQLCAGALGLTWVARMAADWLVRSGPAGLRTQAAASWFELVAVVVLFSLFIRIMLAARWWRKPVWMGPIERGVWLFGFAVGWVCFACSNALDPNVTGTLPDWSDGVVWRSVQAGIVFSLLNDASKGPRRVRYWSLGAIGGAREQLEWARLELARCEQIIQESPRHQPELDRARADVRGWTERLADAEAADDLVREAAQGRRQRSSSE